MKILIVSCRGKPGTMESVSEAMDAYSWYRRFRSSASTLQNRFSIDARDESEKDSQEEIEAPIAIGAGGGAAGG